MEDEKQSGFSRGNPLRMFVFWRSSVVFWFEEEIERTRLTFQFPFTEQKESGFGHYSQLLGNALFPQLPYPFKARRLFLSDFWCRLSSFQHPSFPFPFTFKVPYPFRCSLLSYLTFIVPSWANTFARLHLLASLEAVKPRVPSLQSMYSSRWKKVRGRECRTQTVPFISSVTNKKYC